MKYETMTISPDFASLLLENNTGNRAVNEKHVSRLARAIKNGEWEHNGESIKLSVSNRVLDGQHRLHAIVEAGTGITTLVVSGLPDHVQDTVDLGRKRTNGDALHMDGVVNASCVAAALTFIAGYENGTGRVHHMSPTEAKNLFEKHPGIENACRQTPSKLITPSAMGAFNYLASRIDPILAQDLVQHVTRGEPTNEPIFRLLREKLIARQGKDNRDKAFLLVCKAWNLARTKSKATRLVEPTENFIELI